MKEEIKEIKRFEAGKIAKLTKALDKVFEQTNNCSEDNAVKLEECQITDVAHVCMVVAKTEEAKRVLSLFIDTNNIPKLPPLDYIVRKTDVNTECVAKYSTDYILLIMNILKHTQDYIKISLKEDFPSTLETEHFKFLLAPRIDSDY